MNEQNGERWQSEIRLVTNEREIPVLLCSKKEKQLWLAEFSRAVDWADGASPAKAQHVNLKLKTGRQE